jgi:hypothetical protein
MHLFLKNCLNTLTYDPTLSVSPRLATGSVSARTVSTRGAVQRRCVYTDKAVFINDPDGRCPKASVNKKTGLFCLFHAVKPEEIPKENPNREFLEAARALTEKEKEATRATRRKYCQNADVKLRIVTWNSTWRRETEFFQTPERRAEMRSAYDRDAKARREQLRAAYAESVADMMQRHPNDWQTRIGETINTDAQTDRIVDRIEATPVNELHSLCTQTNQLLLSTIDAPVTEVLNGKTTVSYIGLTGDGTRKKCRAPPGLGIMCDQVSRLRWNCSGAVRQSDYVDGRCSSTQ